MTHVLFILTDQGSFRQSLQPNIAIFRIAKRLNRGNRYMYLAWAVYQWTESRWEANLRSMILYLDQHGKCLCFELLVFLSGCKLFAYSTLVVIGRIRVNFLSKCFFLFSAPMIRPSIQIQSTTLWRQMFFSILCNYDKTFNLDVVYNPLETMFFYSLFLRIDIMSRPLLL